MLTALQQDRRVSVYNSRRRAVAPARTERIPVLSQNLRGETEEAVLLKPTCILTD